ncbi:MAG: 3-deoxy-manno-octulosonate cytidylyltransferase [Verrucomicrobiota bacterium]
MDASKSPQIKRNVLGVIPARWGSTRFPGKILHPIAGKPLVQHVWERCLSCSQLSDLVIATDDDRIFQAVEGFGAKVCMTSPEHPSGTDRIAEVAREFPDHAAIVNIQGDEPLIDPHLIDELAQLLKKSPDLEMVTAANPIDDPELIEDPNVVKVVLDSRHHALYFSRSPLPYVRNSAVDGYTAYRHKGIYGYQRDFVLQFVEWPPSLLEQTEGLEQLRALENGARIQVAITNDESPHQSTVV